MNEPILSFVSDFNQSWIIGKLNQTREFHRENVIFMSPDLSAEIVGIDSCIETFEDYLDSAKTNEFQTTDIKNKEWGDSSIVVLRYFVDYELKGKVYKENCTENWALVKQSKKWKLAWRALIKSEQVQ